MTRPAPRALQGWALHQSVSLKVSDYAVVVVLLVGGALVAKQPQLLALGIPFAAALLLGLVMTQRPHLEISTTVAEDRVVEGDEIAVTVAIDSDVTLSRVELVTRLPPGLSYAEPTGPTTAVPVRAGVTREVTVGVRADVWGVHDLVELGVRVRGPLGFTTYETVVAPQHTVRVFPGSDALRALARPRETTLAVGSVLARRKADGFEFADIRQFVTGDRVRNVNWRATARRGDLRVNDHHPERSSDVVLLVDAFDNTTLPAAVRAAVSLARAYLAERDRVGVVSFGGVLRWLRLGLGERQLYRIIDALIESAALYSYAWKALDLVPPQALPTNALLIAMTPLTDKRTLTALLDRAARGTPVAVVQVSLEPYVKPGPSATDKLGYVMWQHETARIADRLRARGVPVVPWREGEPLAATIEEVAAFQRYARHPVG